MFLAVVASALFLYENFRYWQLNPFAEIELQNVLMAKTDMAGSTYIIDHGRSQIVRLDKNGRAGYEIDGGGEGSVFYNARDIAVEDEKSLFVLGVAWDDSGMSIAAERIHEFDKRSGTFRRRLYELDRRGPGLDRRLSALTALDALKFEDGKLWFVRKGEDSFALCSLVPGEEAVTEYAVGYEDSLRTLDDFTIDVAGKRVFFLDKAGVVKVAELAKDEMGNKTENRIKTLFTPVSGVSAREFSLPYRLTFDGTGLYFSDTGKRAVMRLEGENSVETVFGGWEGKSSKEKSSEEKPSLPVLYYFVHSRGDLLTLASENSVVGLAPGGKEVFRASSLPVGFRVALVRLSLWVSVLVLLSSLLFVLVAVFRLLSTGKLSGKNLVSFVIVIGMGSAFMAVAPEVFNELRVTVKNEIMNQLSYIMEVSSKILDVEALAEINTPQDYDGPAYRKFRRSLDNLLKKENDWDRRIYCDIFKFKDGIWYSVCFLDRTIGAFFDPADSPPAGFDLRGSGVAADSGEWERDMDNRNVSGSYMSLSAPIYNADGTLGGGIEVGVDLQTLERYIRGLAKNALAHILLVLAFLLFLVSEIFESAFFTETSSADGHESEIPAPLLRPFTFAVFLAFNLTTGFLPNYALKMGGSLMGLSPGLTAALPVAAVDIMLTFAPLVSIFLIARLGRRLSFFVSFALCFAGYAISAAAAEIGALVAGMGVLGLGAGVLFTLVQTCLASWKDADEKALAFSSFASASFAGINCGIMTGGIVATNFGQRAVFSLGVFLWAVVAAAFLFLARKAGKKTQGPARAGAGMEAARSAHAPFALPLGIAGFLLLSFFPFTLYSGFVYYLVPVFGSQAGFSDTEISLVFVFFGVGIMFLAPNIIAFARKETKKISSFLWLALFIELAAILCFAFFQSIAAMLAAVFILGGASGVGSAYFPLYLTEMPESKKLREGGDMALFNFTENLGFAAGPMIFSAILHSEASFWYYVLAAAMLLAPLLYNAVWRAAARGIS
jgi:predicted MFS family arabinose efflux permease